MSESEPWTVRVFVLFWSEIRESGGGRSAGRLRFLELHFLIVIYDIRFGLSFFRSFGFDFVAHFAASNALDGHTLLVRTDRRPLRACTARVP